MKKAKSNKTAIGMIEEIEKQNSPNNSQKNQ